MRISMFPLEGHSGLIPGILENNNNKKTVSHIKYARTKIPLCRAIKLFHIETHVEVSDFSSIFYLLYFQFVPEKQMCLTAAGVVF